MKSLLRTMVVKSSPLWDPVYVFGYRMLTGYRGSLPPFTNRRRIGTKWLGDFVGTGRQAADALLEVMRRHHSKPPSELSVLDLGCGCGRIVQALAGRVGKLSAVDIDASAIGFLQRAFPEVHSAVNQSTPPLAFSNGAFDVLYSWSIWTHLPPETQDAWLLEVARVVRPGGLALITTNGPQYFQRFMGSPQAQDPWRDLSPADVERFEAEFRREGFLYRDYPGSLMTDTTLASGVSGRYGMAFHLPAFVRERWSRCFEVLEILESGMHNGQDLVVLRNRQLAAS